ncbi:MAG: sulfite exporter TauE/SafE family protein [Saprospiraceae bacterium]|nr:sulfite exporter TauE/SafE family protein [Saprospiraceae bacterium]
MLLLTILLIVFAASFTKSAFGFGDAIVAMPLITMIAGFEVSSPLVAMLAMLTSSIIIFKEWRTIEFKSILPLLIASFAGVPLGMYLLSLGNEYLMKCILAGVIISFSIYNLIVPKLPRISGHPLLGFLFGGLSGIFGGAYNIAGPPVVIYGSLRQWSPTVFRSSLQGFLAPVALFTVINHIRLEHYPQQTLIYIGASIPVIFLGIMVGKFVNKSIQNPTLFNKIVYGIMVILGLLLILSA